ncbi:PspA/IM30 family protein [Paenibacillus sp. MER TA 81-3]|uniref:PspA/IM30 family protein n=1 Tax=Paenibacillus sp. MER TA 81-3 TaxID=2939573 RepID=UPI00203CB6F3|nr:PspA/IM30 family protein [Paenibacillus sp. MER TA 81-3]MCM3338851.1 PspA/IM30 family protein [Paenibacillus sp. MER TA 81-3]
MSNIFKRVRDITLATLNERLDKVEDPVRLIDQFLMRTRHDIAEADRLYQQYVMHANQMRHQLNQAQEMRDRREQQAMLALKAGEEFAAKIALQEKLMHDEKAVQYADLYDKSKQAILDLEEQLNLLKSEYQTVYDKRQYYFARMQNIRLQQQMNQRFGQYGGGQVDGMFRRLEDRVSDMEWETESVQQVRRMSGQAGGGGLGQELALQREMERLRQKLDSTKE